MKQLNIDIETFSDVDLAKSGVYRYADSSAFEILLFGYAVDKGTVRCVDVRSGEEIPEEVIAAIRDDNVEKHAFNAQFERVCLSKYLGVQLNPASWRCTMIASLYLGLPGSLAMVGTVLGLEKKKLETGKDLIRFFSVPRKPTKTNPSVRNLPDDAPEKWELYKQYNIRDVETEMEIAEKISRFPVPDFVWAQYVLDQKINDVGIEMDMQLVREAIRCDEEFRERHLKRAQELTGLENPNSPVQLKEWLQCRGVEIESLTKTEVSRVLEGDCSGDVREVLVLRQLLAKSSVRKYDAMQICRCSDGRAHGLLQFYGANRTGRWAGRLIQVQNLPQNHISDLAVARDLVKTGCFEALEILYDSVPDILSQLIRTSFVPGEGKKFMVADFSAIEARVIAWLAGEKWRQEVFRGNGDIYCASASQMFGVPVEKHGQNSHLRQKGKIAELALGYGGSVGAMVSMGALSMGLAEEELKPIVDSWRKSNPAIVKLWWDIDKAALEAVKKRTAVRYKCLTFVYESGFLFITLPSGRRLAYVRPRIFTNDFGRDELSYEGITTGKHWDRIDSYGPKITENIIQAISRDILAEAMERLDCAGYRIVMHVHDEAVIEADMSAELEDACSIMSETPEWAPGLVLNAAGYCCEFYQKD